MPNPIERKTFNFGLNGDDSDFNIKPGEYRNGINARTVISEDGKSGSVENVLGNTNVGDATTLPTGINRVIGHYEDEKNQRSYYFVYNSEGHHHIKQYDKSTDTTTIILNDDLFVKDGVNVGLNFRRDRFITGVDMVGDMLFWVDPIPRRINVKRILDGQYNINFNDDLISVVRRPPNIPLTVSKEITNPSGIVSQLKDGAFQFAWRYVYYDGETSVLSPYSLLVDYLPEDDKTDTLVVSLPVDVTIEQDVRFVEIAVRNGNIGDFFIIKRWDRENTADKLAIADYNGGGALFVNFYNDRIGEAIPEVDAQKPFDSVPLTSGGLVAADNRVFLGDNKMGYDTPGKTSLSLTPQKIEIDVEGEVVYGTWRWIAENYKHGFPPHKSSRTAWFLYIHGYDDIDDGYYGVAGVQYSEQGSTRPSSGNNKSPDSTFSFPDPVNYTDLQYIGTNLNDLESFYGVTNAGDRKINVGDATYGDSTIVGAPTGSQFVPQRIFKTGDVINLGVVFYDGAMRSSAVVAGGRVNIEDTKYDNDSFTDKIKWALSNAAASVEIPEWAQYYSIVMTRGLRTRFFMQTYPYEIAYTKKDEDGNYELKKENYDPTFDGLVIDLSSLSRNGLGYAFNKGDVVNLYLETAVGGKDKLSLSVIDQWGKYIVCSLANVGNLTSTINALLELYTPYRPQQLEPYYEIGQVYPVSDPGTAGRTYSVTSGSIRGDTWILSRKFSTVSTNGVEAMSPNDKHYSEWLSDIGRANILPQPGIGQAIKETDIMFSNQYIPKTLINGLCSFDSTNFKSLPDACGRIRKLVYTAKVQDQEGTVMLAICENETVSVYIGEARLMQPTGGDVVASTTDVIGTINTLKGSYGTINPESVVEKDGHVFWLDMKHGKVIRYAVNGLYPISDFKMSGFFNRRCRELMDLTDADIQSLGIEGLYCPGGYDDFHKEYLLFVPKTKALPEFLEDIIRATYTFSLNFVGGDTQQTEPTELSKMKFYGGTIKLNEQNATVSVSYDGIAIISSTTETGEVNLPFFQPQVSGGRFTVTTTAGKAELVINEAQPNIHKFDNGDAKLMRFQTAINKWTAPYMYAPEYFGAIGNGLYSFKDGRMYLHGKGDYNTFYGEWFPTTVCFVCNENALVPRIFYGINVTSNLRPSFIHVRTERVFSNVMYPQSTFLEDSDFSNEEGVYYSPFYFDRFSPNVEGGYDEKMNAGDRIRSQIAMVFIEFGQHGEPIELKELGISYQPSSGHQV